VIRLLRAGGVGHGRTSFGRRRATRRERRLNDAAGI
jgi:hypothetical protein